MGVKYQLKSCKTMTRRSYVMKHLWSVLFLLFISAGTTPAHATAVSITIREWSVPAGSFPHDPAVAPDGALWYTGMQSNTLGRLDPRTGTIRTYPLKTPSSGPHGLVADRDGNIWFTANYKGYIGKLDPETGAVKEYAMPDRDAGDPHTPVFDGRGILWFTVQQGNFVGRLDPATGKITLRRSPTSGSKPYGIVVTSKGIPFYCELGTNKIGRIDPVTMTISEFVLPEGARPRRIAVTKDDMIWYTDYRRGYLGRLNPNDGSVEEWPSPGGKASKPYGMAVTPDGDVWYSESGVEPNTIVRFDPKTHKFDRWSIPSGGGVVRNMVATTNGEIYIACSGDDKVGVVKVKR
jgi:virginiamycin B lyase